MSSTQLNLSTIANHEVISLSGLVSDDEDEAEYSESEHSDNYYADSSKDEASEEEAQDVLSGEEDEPAPDEC
jgi:hypothetical protein